MEFVVSVMWVVMLMMMIPNALSAQHNCGYDSCPRGEPGMLNVHLVPHTHDDVGWLKTVDQYYYGSRNEIQRAGVQYILDSVIKELLTDPSKRFIYVETAFLWRWYRQQDSQTRAAVADLVNQGRLEFIGGGWSMNDEACAHYNAMIDQMSLGMRLLRDNFGPCGVPRVAWQIDPFGHSKEQANLFAQMGFDGYFFGRLDYDDKDRRMNDTEMEMVWLASPDLGSELFTGVLPNLYQPPSGFCFDLLCDDEPIMDDPTLRDSNVDQKVDDFLRSARAQSQFYKSDNIIMTMGSDFHYQDAHVWYKNMDKLIKYVNMRQRSGGKVNTFYSTPSCYLKALHDSHLVWPTKEDDFMPYASDPWAYWTGYFTSRPAQKRLIRQSNNFLQICKQMSTLFQSEDMSTSPTRVDYLRHAMGVNQHHDAVTGTEKQHVANDYIQRLSEATNICYGPINDAFIGAGAPAQEFCGRLNVSECHMSEQQQKFVVYLYNPLARVRSHWVRIPVVTRNYIVMDPDGKQVVHQVTPLSDAVMRLPGRTSKAKFELIFKATDLPPLGFKGFFVMRVRYSKPSSQSVVTEGQYNLFGDTAYLHVNPPTRQVFKVGSPAVDLNVKPTFMWYKGYGDVNGSEWKAQRRPSGAYVFHPEGQAELFDAKAVRAVEGALCSEFQQSYAGDWVAQTVRVYSGEPYIEVDWIVGPIPIRDGVAKEIVLRYNSNIASGDVFYTDSNGRQMMKRKRNHRSTWKLNVTEPVTGNYYPVNSRIFIQDKHLQLTVLNDRSQGGSSLNSGQLELMLHRRTVQDDGFGVGEPLNETEFGQGLVVRGRHLILISNVDDAPRLHRQLAEEMFMSPLVSFVATPHMTAKEWRQNPGITTQFEGASALPDNVHLLTLEMYRPGEMLVRLEHQYQSNEDHVLSKPVTVNLMELFNTLKLTSLEEFGLAADRPLAEIDRLQWNHAKASRPPWYLRRPLPLSTPIHQKHTSFLITLKPMQIRTFVIQYSHKTSRFQQRF